MASEFQRTKITGVFEAMDADGDGFLRESDFAALTARWTAIRGGDGHLSQEEFVRLWTEFWSGDDPDAPDSWVFGRFEPPLVRQG